MILSRGVRHDHVVSVLFGILAAACLSRSVQINDGAWNKEAFGWVATGLVFALGGALLPRLPNTDPLAERLLPYAFAGGIAFETLDLLRRAPALYQTLHGPEPTLPFHVGVAIMAVAAGLSLGGDARLTRVALLSVLGAYVMVASWIVHTSPNPFIDVHVFQRDSIQAFLQGRNPYELTFPNIYGNGAFYGPGIVKNGRVLFGFVYPPISLLLLLPGQLIFGEYRFSHLTAMALAGALIYATRPGRTSAGAAAMLVMFSRGFFVVEQGWTEPFVIVMLAATVFTAARAPRFLPYVLGIFFATKQYLFLAAPAALLLVRPWSWRSAFTLMWKAALVGLIVTLPFFLWNPKAFLWSVIELQIHQPFRDDSLSALVWYAQQAGTHPPVWIAFAAAAIGACVGLWRFPRTPSGFASGVALTFYMFIFFNKQSFCNYYFFVAGAILIGVGTADTHHRQMPEMPAAPKQGVVGSAQPS